MPNTPMAERLRAMVRRVPEAPGVYRFRDARGRILYVGRATRLRSRVRSYWGDLRDRAHLTPMVRRIAEIEVAVCGSEHEAAFLERNLLSVRLPAWNRAAGGGEAEMLICLDERGLHVLHADDRRAHNRSEWLFGPFLGGLRVRTAASGLLRIFPLAYAQATGGAHRALAEALGIATTRRQSLARSIAAVLERDPRAVAEFRAAMTERRTRSAAGLRFESAARIHQELTAVDWVVAEQKATLREPLNLDIHGWAGGQLIRFEMRDGRLCGWTRRRCTKLRAADLLTATPEPWRSFAATNAELAAALRGSPC